ncbi:MAG: hypothetical protein ACKO37_02035 [Vampirovibrionales bacterium]
MKLSLLCGVSRGHGFQWLIRLGLIGVWCFQGGASSFGVAETPTGPSPVTHAMPTQAFSKIGLQPLSEVFKYQGQVLHWQFSLTSQTPVLTLYWVPSTPFQGFHSPQYNPMIREATQAWLDALAPVRRDQGATNPYVQAQWVTNPEDAAIHVRWVYQVVRPNDKLGTFHPAHATPPQGVIQPYQMAITEPVFHNAQLKRMTVTFSTHKASGNAYSPKERYHMILHEMGHALGLMGHSRWAGSIMGAGFSTRTLPLTPPSASKPSYWIPLPESDQQHIQALYRTPADITNP